ncbi:MAG: S46 family peptidase, partial [Bacteroidota bacterium]|nr:S46 family peptidase [Bacteroidota bacterium]
SEEERSKKISESSKKLIKAATTDTHYGGVVKAMYEGNRFYLFVYETFKDIRLVGAPPSAIGKYGGDTDNWMWPRHTGDFSMFRIYSGTNNKPLEYTKDNKAYTPKHHFPISLDGHKNNDFAFVMGFPGSTDRYMTSYGIAESLDKEYPARVKIRGKKLEVMKKFMNQSQKVRIQYASKYARVSNYWKYFIGQSKGLKKLKVYDKKKNYENELQAWINNDANRKAKYGETFKLIEDAYKEKSSNFFSIVYFSEALRGIEITSFSANAYYGLSKILKDNPKDSEKIAKAVEALKESGKSHFKDYDQATDKLMTAEMLAMFIADVDPAHYPGEIAKIAKKYKGDYSKYADKLFAKSLFANEENYNDFLEKPSAKKLKNDPAFNLYISIRKKQGELYKQIQPSFTKLNKGRRLMLAAMLDKENGKLGYPDANSTPRFTYGYVGDYNPADAVHFKHYTTIEGIMEKEDPTNPEFTVPVKLKELYNKNDYGRYADNNGDMIVCFTTNNDITGGNSGSPVLNAKGELTGVAFDGNWEAMSGDIAFETELQKCINVDIRYVLFIIDKYAGATNLIDEMTIMQTPKAPVKINGQNGQRKKAVMKSNMQKKTRLEEVAH